MLLGVVQAGNDLASMRQWQDRVRASARKGLAATVGLGSARTGTIGTGVIVSSDGLVLSAAHVISTLGPDLVIHLPDGRRLPGKPLGYDADTDAAMARIDRPGPFPHVRLRAENAAGPGEWVVAIGHTGGVSPDRGAPIRIGRVLQNEQARLAGGFIYSDCTLAGGDSGGPLLDLDGRLVGVHSQIGTSLLENMHVPTSAFRQHWAPLRAGKRRIEESRRLHIEPEGPDADWGALTPMLEELKRLFPDGQAPRFMMLPHHPGAPPPQQAKEFGGLLEVCEPVVDRAARATVEIFSQPRERLAYGLVVRPDGYIVTKASEIVGQPELQCRLANGRVAPARLERTAPQHDLALLRIRASRLTAAKLEDARLPLGSFLAAPAPDGTLLSIGVHSVAARPIPARDRGYLGVVIENHSPAGALVTKVIPDSPAAAAGLREDDIIVLIGRRPVDTVEDLTRIVGDARPGFPVTVGYHRGGAKRSCRVQLANREDADATRMLLDMSEMMGGDLSAHRSGYPSALQHDLTLHPDQVGGPLVDLEGRVVGLNIARTGRTGCFAIPATTLRDLLRDPKAWRPAR